MKNKFKILLGGVLFCSFSGMSQGSIGVGAGIIKSTEENSEVLLGGELYGKYEITEAFRAGVNLGFYNKSESVELLGEKYNIKL